MFAGVIDDFLVEPRERHLGVTPRGSAPGVDPLSSSRSCPVDVTRPDVPESTAVTRSQHHVGERRHDICHFDRPKISAVAVCEKWKVETEMAAVEGKYQSNILAKVKKFTIS